MKKKKKNQCTCWDSLHAWNDVIEVTGSSGEKGREEGEVSSPVF